VVVGGQDTNAHEQAERGAGARAIRPSANIIRLRLRWAADCASVPTRPILEGRT
jgi:hypothetical protein